MRPSAGSAPWVALWGLAATVTPAAAGPPVVPRAGARAPRETAGRILESGAATLNGGARADVASSSGDHTRPAALAADARGGLLYVALSTADALLAVDVTSQPPGIAWRIPICRHPTSLAAMPGGGVVVSCRFDPALRLVTPSPSGPVVRSIPTGPEHGLRGVAVGVTGRYAYVASAALGGVKVISLAAPAGTTPQVVGAAAARFRSTGIDPEVVRVFPDLDGKGGGHSGARQAAADSGGGWLLVANRISHTVTLHAIAADGDLSPAIQTISTAAPVLDAQVTAEGLWLFTYEDRPTSRIHRDVEGLDSVVLALPRHRAKVGVGRQGDGERIGDIDAGASSRALPFDDPGPGRRRAINFTERPGAPMVALESSTVGDDSSRRVAIVGAGTDNLWIGRAFGDDAQASGVAGEMVPVGANPVAVAILADGRIVTADRLSDTLTFVPASPLASAEARSGRRTVTVAVGNIARASPAELGELLFFSRALVPNNVAVGPLSVYTCAACHVDGHIDGRRHPAKFNRFFSMTKTCRGLTGTEPFLSLGEPATLAAFADNIVSTHAQGAAKAPETFDRYDVTLRVPATAARGGRAHASAGSSVAWVETRLGPNEVRSALAAYLAHIEVEPSPFVAPGRRVLSAPERRGLRLFRASCAGCHRLVRSTAEGGRGRESKSRDGMGGERLEGAALEYALLTGGLALTARGRFDVGTPVLGDGGNNPPSLRGVWAAAPYFSDGSAATLEDVLARTDPGAARVHDPASSHATSGARPWLSTAGRGDLLAFLRAL